MVLRVIGLALLAAGLQGVALLAAQTPASDSEQPNPAAATPEAPPILSCPAGGPLGAVSLKVQSPKGDRPLPFQTINHLSEGDTLLYAPVLRGKEKRPGEISLVLVPAKRKQGEEALIVTDPKPAEKAEEWKITETISVAAFVYGPQGLSKKKVRQFLSQDDLLVAQLADYADRTAQAEALVSALSSSESSSASVNAALTGFASQYGFAVQIDKTAPPATQAETLFATMNPQLATYNPLGSSTAERAGQTASLATTAATLFFGSPVGIAAGSTAMLLDLRAIAFPDTQFRSSFAQTLPNAGVNLCGQRGPTPPHTRVAFIWGSRIPNAPAPSLKTGDASYIPAAQKSPVPVEDPETSWKYLQRARSWSLTSDKGQKVEVPVLKLGNQKALELDLTKVKLAPGDYKLTGYWDWVPFQASGDIHVRPLSDFHDASVAPASQDQLLAKEGKVPVTLTGSDFEFTTKVQLKQVGDEFATAEPVRFLLPTGLRKGPQDHMDVQINTADLNPGKYQLLIAQQDGKDHTLAFNVLPNPPKIDNLPILANQGVATQHYVLKGERLSLISRLEVPDASLELSPASGDKERNITVQLKSNPSPGTSLPIKAFLQDRNEPLSFPDALQITGPLPLIASSRLSLPTGMAISMLPSEFPAAYTLTAVLDAKNIERQSVLHLACADGVGQNVSLRIGEQTSKSSLQQLSPDQLFVSFDTSGLPAGCLLQATIDNGRDGKSQPATLAQIVRVPQIQTFTSTGNASPEGMHVYSVVGQNLEMIQKVGWERDNGADVSSLPSPVPGQGQTQSLQFNLPDPPNPQAPILVWLRGDKEGRATTFKIQGSPSTQTPSAGASNTPSQKPAVPASANVGTPDGTAPPNVL